jgi:hypothetical protein
MKAFCMSVHVSVVQDFKTAYPDIEVVDWCMSGASWIFKRKMELPKIINHETWKNITPKRIEAFQAEYDTFFRQFDLFIVAHPTAFALIFEKYGKPILMINTTRYDLPFCNSRDLEMLTQYQACLRRMSSEGRLHIVSNNHADRYYLKRMCGLDSTVIPSLGLYTEARYAPTKAEFILYHGELPDHPLVAKKPSFHQWKDIASYRGLISIPYEVSLMSLFEYFTAGVPLFFPSKTYWKSIVTHQTLYSMFWYWDDRLPEEFNDLNDLNRWIDESDLYKTFQSPNTYYFDSIPHLFELLETFEYKDDRAFRQEHIDRAKLEWRRVIQRVQSDAFWTKSPRHLCYNRLPLLANVVFDVNYAGTGVVPQHSYPNRTPLTRGDVVFVKTERLSWFLERFSPRAPITLVTGVSDASPPLDVCDRICKDPNVRTWIGCNLPVSHPKIVKMPISVGEPERPNGDHETLAQLYANRIPWAEKQADVCVPYHGDTHSSRTLQSTLPKLPFEDYMKEISRHQFVVCQRGNGLDTHRVCEVLLMGSIPVLEHSPLDDMYSQWNCLLVDSLTNVDVSGVNWDPARDESFLDVFWLRDALRDRLL